MIQIITNLPADIWDEYARAGSHYHRWGWGEVLAGALGHRVRRFAAMEGDRVTGILPLAVVRSPAWGTFAVSLPTVNYGGVLADNAAAAQALAEAGLAWARQEGAKWVLLRQAAPAATGWPEAVSRHTLVLPLAADPWRGLDHKVRNQVRKAEKSGVEVSPGTPAGFHRVFTECMRDLGTPAYGLAYFKAIADSFADARFHQVTQGQAVIGGAVTLTHGGVVETPWACSLRSARAACPQMLLYWRLIEEAAAAGRAEFDFGRSPLESGTYRFKLQWGAQPRPLPWQYWSADGRPVESGADNPRFELARSAWQRLPLPVARRLGPVVARWLP